MRKEVHLTFDKDENKWCVIDVNRDRTYYIKKEDAEYYGRLKSELQNAEFIPHRKDGIIQDPDSFGNDPRSSRG